MLRYFLPALAASAAFAAGPVYEVSGRILPRGGASVSLYGTNSSYAATVFVAPGFAFRFKKLQPGPYVVVVFMRSRGEAHRTVEVGPGTADLHGRVSLQLDFNNSDFELSSALRSHTVSAKQLAIPAAALREFREAQKDLAKLKVDSAVKHLEDTVERAPQFSAAWNTLGTIAYKSRKYDRAEECFRAALDQDPQSFEALVNLGGVLVTEHKLDEALERNVQAVAARPEDALANSQLGMPYFLLNRLDLARKHLEQARDKDPAHFSYPQLLLFEIHLRQGDPHGAADVLDDFLAHHPDWPQSSAARKTSFELRSR